MIKSNLKSLVSTLLSATLIAGCAVFRTPTFEETTKSIETGAVPHWQSQLARFRDRRREEHEWTYVEMWNALDKDGLRAFDSTLVRLRLDAARFGRFSSSPQQIQASANDAYMAWLGQQILTGSGDVRYSYVYADWLWRARGNAPALGEVAEIMLTHARLAAEIDGARCADGSNAKDFIAAVESQPFFNGLTTSVEYASEARRYDFLLNAVAIEKVAGEREPQPFLCKRGVTITPESLMGGEIKAATDADGLPLRRNEGVINLPPAMLDDQEWRSRRAAILDARIRSISAQK